MRARVWLVAAALPALLWGYAGRWTGIDAATSLERPQAIVTDLHAPAPVVGASLAGRPMFVANRGQMDRRVRFMARGNGYTLFLTDRGATVAINSGSGSGAAPRSRPSLYSIDGRSPGGTGYSAGLRQTVVRLDWRGARPAGIHGIGRQRATLSSLVGGDRRAWRSGIPAYSGVAYRDLYPGIDLVFHATARGGLEYDWIVHAGADTARIRLAIRGGHTRLDSNGTLITRVAGTVLRQSAPVMYQRVGHSRVHVRGGFMRSPNGTVRVRPGRYDRSRPLVVDPTIAFSTNLGGGLFDVVRAVATDAAGNIYVTGQTASNDFPGLAPGQSIDGATDIVVAELDPSGRLLWATLVGGNRDDVGTGIGVDASGNIYVDGFTSSTDFTAAFAFQGKPGARTGSTSCSPAAGGLCTDAVAFELTPGGTGLRYSTYLGGAGADRATGIAVDAQGNAFIGGWTESRDFPTAQGGGSQLPSAKRSSGLSGFVARLDPKGGLTYSTYLSGSTADAVYAIATDGTGNAYVAGSSNSTDFPALHPFQTTFNPASGEGFVARLDGTGHVGWASRFGGADMHAIDQTTAFGVGVDAAGDVFVGGTTTAASFPTTAAYQPSPASTSCLTVANTQGACADAFVIKVAPAGDLLLYSTFLGGTGWDAGQALAVDPAGDAFLAGYTYSTDFPAPNAPPGAGAQHSGAGPCDASALAITEPPCGDAFLAELDPDGTSLAYGLYLGGGDFDAANAVTVDQAGDAVAGGVTDSTDFPTVHPVEGPQSGSGCASLGGAAGACGDGFVVKIAPDRIGSPTPTASPTTTPTPVPTATRTAIPPTATPTKTKAPIHKCPRNATKKHGKCACKKGYKMVKGKCRKVKKHH